MIPYLQKTFLLIQSHDSPDTGLRLKDVSFMMVATSVQSELDAFGGLSFHCRPHSLSKLESKFLRYRRLQHRHERTAHGFIRRLKSRQYSRSSSPSAVHRYQFNSSTQSSAKGIIETVTQKIRVDGKPFIKLATLSESSPQSSFSSFSLSPTSLTSGRSTPWTQNSGHNAASSAQYISTQPRMQVSSLLSDSHSWFYHLEVVQHPLRTAEFGGASLSRLPLAPPVIVQLIVRDRTGNSIIPEMELPFLVAHLSLFSGDGLTPLDMSSPPSGEAPPRRLLYGNIVSSPQRLRDLQGKQGLYFLFPDVSIRWRGRFQLGITLLRLSRTDASGAVSMAEHGTVLAQTRTRTFDVLSHGDYIAPPQTRLTQCFLRQGVRMYTSAVSHLGPH